MTNEEMIAAELKGISEKLTELVNQGRERMILEARTRTNMEAVFALLPRSFEDSMRKLTEMRKTMVPSTEEAKIG